ncbi:MAG: hypothetical protein M0042_13300 [Nitrospiraceae bacterium]|nr:hypothetical protein [Nitrospiraceae bacterium]
MVAKLRHSGSAPWEEAYAVLLLDELPFGARRFGWRAIWSPCSRYFAISEWRHAGETFGPDAQLVLIDVVRRRECIIERAEGGFIDPVFINDGVLKYSMITQTMAERIVGYRKIEDLSFWRTVSESQSSEVPKPIVRSSSL